MSPLLLAAVWIAGGFAGALLRPMIRRHRLIVLIPLVVIGAVSLTATAAVWPGPAGTGHGLVLSRLGAGLLIVSALAMAATLLLAPGLDGTEILPAGIAGGATVIIVSATSPIVWAVATGLAIGSLAVRWVSRAPGRAALASGRVGGLGAAAMVSAAPFLVAVGPTGAPRSTLAGVLLAVGVVAVLGVVPLGGWAAGCLAGLRGVEMAPWVVLLAPATLVSAGAVAGGLSQPTRETLQHLLLVAGLSGAVWGGINACRAAPAARYGRILLADVALGVAALGTARPAAGPAVLVIVLLHICVAPLLLHGSRPGLGWPRRLAWFGVSGAPLTPGFWARFLVLEACAASAGVALSVALVASALLLFASVPEFIRERDPGDSAVAARLSRLGAWGVVAAALGLGLAPQAAVRLVFGAG